MHKLNFKWIKIFNIRQDTLNLLEEKEGNKLNPSTQKKIFREDTNRSTLRQTINKRYWIKLKTFCLTNDTIIQAKSKHKKCE